MNAPSVQKTRAAAIFGAGLAGSLLATLLQNRGIKTVLYEKRADPRASKTQEGRSINLAISVRGLIALKEIGIAEEALKIAIPMQGRMIHAIDGKTTFQPYNEKGDAIYSISRAALNILLLETALKSGVTDIVFDSGLVDIDLKEGMATLASAQTAETRTVPIPEVVFGTDGSASILRQKMADTFGTEVRLTSESHGYKELTIPAAENGTHVLEKNALHIWPRKSFMLIALPNLDGSFTATLFLAREGKLSFAKLTDAAKVRSFFTTYFADALTHMPQLEEQFFANPIGHLQTVRCFPWHQTTPTSSALLLGDAAHGIVPFYGQGMNAAFESCVEFVRAMDQGPDQSWESLFYSYTMRRKPNTDAIATMALDNFIEMRDKVGDERFLLQKEVGRRLATRFPDQFISQYSLVSFSNVPYAQALASGAEQERILQRLMENMEYADEIDWNLAHRLVTDISNQPR